MNAAWFEQLAVQALALPPWPDPRFPPSPYYRFLRLLAANAHPALSVELGVSGGGASFHLAVGWPDGQVVGVENADGSDFERENWQHVAERCPNWTLWRGDSVDGAPEIAKVYGEVDILFVDTVHTIERTVAEWRAWEPFMAGTAVICLDDLHRPGMQEAWDWLPWEKVRLDDLHPGGNGDGGFGVAWRSQDSWDLP